MTGFAIGATGRWRLVGDRWRAAHLDAVRLTPDQIEDQVHDAEREGHQYDSGRIGDAASFLKWRAVGGEVIVPSCHRSAPIKLVRSGTLLDWRKFRTWSGRKKGHPRDALFRNARAFAYLSEEYSAS